MTPPLKAATEEMNRTRPKSRSRIPGNVRRASRKGARIDRQRMVEDRGIDVLETGLAREAVIGDEDVHRSERRLDIVDQLFWRPIVAWSEKFRMEKSSSAEQAHSWVLDLIREARVPKILSRWYIRLRHRMPKVKLWKPPPISIHLPRKWQRMKINDDLIFGLVLGVSSTAGIYVAVRFILTEAGPHELAQALGLGCLTFLRVIFLLAVSTLIWTPIGVAIGFNPRLARFMQPLVLLLASFPANFLFPLATLVFIKLGITLNWGSILLMAIGAQWYVLFNVIAGAMGVPSDLREMATNMRLTGWPLWKKLIIPAIFPAWVTGAITASGGAWNASIVAEVVPWGKQTLSASGLGSYIAAATSKGDWPRIVLGVMLMCIFVVSCNRFVWRRLYSLAETRYSLG